jgi:UDP-N-acetylglucosamine acyltransferase
VHHTPITSILTIIALFFMPDLSQSIPMTVSIHPTAIVSPTAQLGNGVSIGPYSIIGPHVVLGDNVMVHSHVVIDGHTTIGAGSTIFPFASLGTAPQDLKYRGEPSRLIIGARNTIREHVTMNLGTAAAGGEMATIIGNDGLYMVGVHIAHDCRLGDRVIMANNATLAGHVTVGDHVLIGGLSAVHQFVRIGHHAVIGGMSGVERDVIPFGRVKGERAFLDGLNLTGLERSGFDKEAVRTLQRAFNAIFHGQGTFEERLAKAEQDFSDIPSVVDILSFARSNDSKFSLCQPKKS